ncbi:MAG: AEC family transporter [Lachnospiraceae bacterium]|nr:AEC family transporter [Lachnospiraceae bacterium]MCI1727236.1 AEC family transporter [Lachnospiraceae bacterium]
MAITIVFTQLCVLMTFLMLGFFTKKKGYIHDIGVKDLSWIVINIGNPCQILSSVLNTDVVSDKGPIIEMFIVSILTYGALMVIGLFMGALVRAPKHERKVYNMMTVFGNLGFVGLPLVQAVYGAGAVLYVVDFILVYNILMFSYGTFVLRPEDGEKNGGLLKNLMNPGFIASIVTIIFFFFDIRLPAYFQSVTLYGGEIVVALAIFTIGANLADLKMKEVVNDPHVWAFIVIRQMVLPVCFLLVLKLFIHDPVLLGSYAVVLSVPVGNVVSMVANKNGLDVRTITKGTVLTTVLSVLTITFVTVFV